MSKVIVPTALDLSAVRGRVRAAGNAAARRATHIGGAIASKVPATWNGTGAVPTGWTIPYGEEVQPLTGRVAIVAEDAFAAGQADFAGATSALPNDWETEDVNRRWSDVLDIYATGSVFTTGYYALDATSGLVAGFIDHLDPTHALAQSVEALQVKPAAFASFNGSHFYLSSRPTSAWKYLHDGTGCSWTLVWIPRDLSLTGRSNTLLATYALTFSTQAGIIHSYVSGGVPTVPSYQVAAASATRPVNDAAQSNVVTIHSPVSTSGTLKDGAWSRKSCGAVEASGAVAATPSSANPRAPLVLGALDTGAQGAVFDFAALLVRPSPLSAEEEQAQQAWISAAYGAAA